MLRSVAVAAVFVASCATAPAAMQLAAPVGPPPPPPPAPGAAWPFAYNWSAFPAAWFGANASHWESDAQIEAIGRYELAIFGWQHLDTPAAWTDVVYFQLAQAALVKAKHPRLPVFVYTSFGWAFGLNAGVQPIMHDPSYADFFLRSDHGSFEFSDTDCQQGHTSPSATADRCVGYFWNMANASARAYFLEHLVAPIAKAPMIDGVFYDAFNYGYDIPEVRPWGKQVVNVPGCGNHTQVWSGCEALIAGSIALAKEVTALLNANGKIPMFANPGSFVKPPKQEIWLDEARLVKALEGMAWSTYYESARAENALFGNPGLPNMLREGKAGVAAGVHTYLKSNATTKAVEPQLAHLAQFMLAREAHWYYFGSTGWWDSSFTWDPLYDKAAACGLALGPATVDAAGLVFTRKFASGCTATLRCANKTAPDCTADIAWR